MDGTAPKEPTVAPESGAAPVSSDLPGIVHTVAEQTATDAPVEPADGVVHGYDAEAAAKTVPAAEVQATPDASTALVDTSASSAATAEAPTSSVLPPDLPPVEPASAEGDVGNSLGSSTGSEAVGPAAPAGAGDSEALPPGLAAAGSIGADKPLGPDNQPGTLPVPEAFGKDAPQDAVRPDEQVQSGAERVSNIIKTNVQMNESAQGAGTPAGLVDANPVPPSPKGIEMGYSMPPAKAPEPVVGANITPRTGISTTVEEPASVAHAAGSKLSRLPVIGRFFGGGQKAEIPSAATSTVVPTANTPEAQPLS